MLARPALVEPPAPTGETDLRAMERRGRQSSGSRDWTTGSTCRPADGVFEGYHDRLMSFSTSPSRKIDPATTIAGDARHARASAASGSGSISIGRAGDRSRATAAIDSGSAERGVDAAVAIR